MRRVVSTVLVAFGVLGLSLGVGAVAASAAGKKVCTVTDDRLVELSGLVATANGYAVVNDSSDDQARERVFLLDARCKVKTAVQYSGNGPYDPEDLAISPNGKTLWIADIGDNITSDERRTSVVLWSMPVSGSAKPVLHRVTYPGGKAHDAEALLIGADGVPLIITKTTGKAEIYRPTAPLKKGGGTGVPLARAGEIQLPRSTTANPFGPAGRVTVTGAARSPDGTRVALRTYADAYEWDVADGDVVKALTTTPPRATPLADPFGEAIAYTPDGKSFLTVSDVGSLGEDAEVAILSYVPARQVAAAVDAAGGAGKKADRSWTDSLTLDDITYLIAAVGVVGVVLVGLGVFGILRARRRQDGDGQGVRGADDDDDNPLVGRQPVPDAGAGLSSGRIPGRDDYDGSGWGPAPRGYGDGRRTDRAADDYDGAGRGRQSPGGGVYGGRASGGGAGAVYGGQPAGGGVYGGQPVAGGPPGRPRAGGGVYGGTPANGYGGARGRPDPADHPDAPPGNGYAGPRAGHYGQPRQRRSEPPEGYDYR